MPKILIRKSQKQAFSQAKHQCRTAYAEMLKLNAQFTQEHENILRQLGRKFFNNLSQNIENRRAQIHALHISPSQTPGRIRRKLHSVLKDQFTLWENYCRRWLIDPYGWHGQICQLRSVHICSLPLVEGSDQAIRLHITQFTTIEDIKKIWPDIQKQQKRGLTSYGTHPHFQRNLDWYYAIKIKGLSYRKLFDHITTKKRSLIEDIVFSGFRKKKKWNIDVYTNKEMRASLAKNRSQKHILELFEQDVEYYINYKYASFRSLVKRVIRHLEERVALLRPTDWFMGQPNLLSKLSEYN